MNFCKNILGNVKNTLKNVKKDVVDNKMVTAPDGTSITKTTTTVTKEK